MKAASKNTEKLKTNNCLLSEFLRDTGYSKEELKFCTASGKDIRSRDILLFYEKNGNIHIPYLTIEGAILQFSKGNKLRDFERIRLANPENSERKYTQPKSSGSHPYFPSQIIEKYKAGEKINTLFLTEGEKKAMAGCKKLDIPFVSIPGIHCVKDFEKENQLHNDLIKLIERCEVKQIVLLFDADALQCKYNKNNPEKDLSIRAHSFLKAVTRFKELLKPHNVDIYFAVINPRLKKGSKGVDDLLLDHENKLEQIKHELNSQMTGGKVYTIWHNVTGNSDTKLKEFFGLTNAQKFYELHKEEIGPHPFTLKRQKFQCNGEKLELIKENRNDVFWKPIKDKEGDTTGCNIIYYNLIHFLQNQGFIRFDIGDTFRFLKIENNLISEINETHIQDFVVKHVKNLSDGLLKYEVKKEEILAKIYNSPQTFFSRNKLSLLESEDLAIKKDTLNSAFVFYNNGYVEITKDGYELKSYDCLDLCIYKDQRQERNFSKDTEDGSFKKFVKNITGDDNRFLSLRTILGYLMHDFYEYKRKAVNLTDSSISDDDDGRTGKTLVLKSTEHIRKYTEIPGKGFDLTNKQRYDEASLSTQIIHINDTKRSFDLENVYNDITDCVEVNEKWEKPFKINAKFAISSNKPLRVSGGSDKDRIIEFELTDYYSEKYCPEKEFKQWFFRGDWAEEEWNAYDNFMLECIRLFLENGIIEPTSINLEERKLKNETNLDFIDFIEGRIEEEAIKIGEEFNKKLEFNKFLEYYPEYEKNKFVNQQRTFTKWLLTYAKYRNFETDKEKVERKSGNYRYFKFLKKD